MGFNQKTKPYFAQFLLAKGKSLRIGDLSELRFRA